MSFQCTLVTPEQQAYDGRIKQAIVPAHDGLIGILTDRAPLLVKLGTGPLRLDPVDGGSLFYFIAGGIAQMKGNRLTVLTSEAKPAGEIDYEAARAQYAAAAARHVSDPAAAAARQKDLERARALMATVQKT